ncbi:MAG: TrmH family RNA methyltransferase [Patescibacteria group bacterium]
MEKRFNIILILYNLRSEYNVGAIFRTAEGAGVSKIYLVGTTPTPKDRFKRLNKSITKTALGAEKNVAWEYHKTLKSIINILKKEKIPLVALEQDKKSLDYRCFKPSTTTAVIVGSEVKGLSSAILNYCQQILEIPMQGQKESLNVSVAVGVLLFRLNDYF